MSRLKDGYPTTITFSASSSAAALIFEKSVTPPSVSAGGENDTTTMRNDVWRTKQPKALKTLGEASFVAAYDPAFYDEVVGMIGVNQQITINYPDDSTLMFWGWLDEFTPGECVDGAQPTAACRIIASNENDSDEETAPVYTAPA